MRVNRRVVVALVLGMALVGLPLGSAWAQNVSVGINTPSVTFGLNVGAPPPLVAVPGLPVYQAPSVPDNYFVYQGYYLLPVPRGSLALFAALQRPLDGSPAPPGPAADPGGPRALLQAPPGPLEEARPPAVGRSERARQRARTRER